MASAEARWIAPAVPSPAGGRVAAVSSTSSLSATRPIRRMIRWPRGIAPGSASQMARSTSALCRALDTSDWSARSASQLASACDSGSVSASFTSAEESR